MEIWRLDLYQVVMFSLARSSDLVLLLVMVGYICWGKSLHFWVWLACCSLQ